MTHGSLFTGIGGFDLAAERVGFENIFQVENNNFCKKVLEKNFPNVKRYNDIKEFIGTKYKGKIDVISGGFPCQPYSIAGKRRGKEDDRSLWHEMLRIIKEIRPPFILCENVTGLISMELDEMLFDLEGEGYKTETFILPAISVNAPHIRNRVWIIAYSNSYAIHNKRRSFSSEAKTNEGKTQRENWKRVRSKSRTISALASNTISRRFEERMQHIYFRETKNINERTWNDNWYEVAAELCGVDDGLPARMDGLKLTKAQYRSERLKSLGNSIVPNLAIIFFELINAKS